MYFKNIPTGNDVPNDIYAIIEIPCHSYPVKYEINKDGVLYVDRFISTSMFYPCNYGYINNTIADDGDHLDVLVYSKYPLQIGSVINCRPIGLLKMIDESGEDNKIIAVPHQNISQDYNNIKNIEELPHELKNKIVHFFKHYKDIEKGKWVKNVELADTHAAKDEIIKNIIKK